MAEQLFPVFEIPSVTVHAQDVINHYFWPGPLFDFSTGDFVRDGANRVVMVDGRDEYILWVLKTIKTQLGACTAYPEYGIDIEGAIAENERSAVQSAFERTITEGLMRNPRTERVFSFEFGWEADELTIYFIVKPKNLDAFDVNMNVAT